MGLQRLQKQGEKHKLAGLPGTREEANQYHYDKELFAVFKKYQE